MGKTVKIIGAGLAGCEACYALAKRGVDVILYEMRPKVSTAAHQTDGFAELVCSNSLKSEDENTAQGALKREMRAMDSLILKTADKARVPAGGALAVDRKLFSELVEIELRKFENVHIVREECVNIDENTIIAAGPLASDGLCKAIGDLCGEEFLSFYDAVAPIITSESVDFSRAFTAGRYNKGGDDYINCEMDREEYYAFTDSLVNAERVVLREFEKRDVFSACMPIEVMASKGADTLRFGPLRPVGLINPNTGKRPYAAVQLRKEDEQGRLLNIVGFQTNLKFGEQKRVFSMIPALKNAEFVRYGVMHRNTFVNAPKVLASGFELKKKKGVFIAGQLSGVEGYAESAASGIIAGINAYKRLVNEDYFLPPETTLIGGLMKYLATENNNFQPMHVGFPLTPELETRIRDKQKRKEAYSQRAAADFNEYVKKTI